MSQSGWISEIRVIGGFLLVFAGIASLGIFLAAAGHRSGMGAIVWAASSALCLGIGATLLWAGRRHGGVTGPKPAPKKRLSYHQRVRGRTPIK